MFRRTTLLLFVLTASACATAVKAPPRSLGDPADPAGPEAASDTASPYLADQGRCASDVAPEKEAPAPQHHDGHNGTPPAPHQGHEAPSGQAREGERR